jgi:hypothetical protein
MKHGLLKGSNVLFSLQISRQCETVFVETALGRTCKATPLINK